MSWTIEAIGESIGAESDQGPHVIAVEYGEESDEDAKERYLKQHPFASGLFVFVQNFSNVRAKMPVRKAGSDTVNALAAIKSDSPSSEQKESFEIPPPLRRLPGDALGPEPPEAPEEERKPANIDIITGVSDGDPELKKKYGNRLVNLAEARRKRGPHSWM